VPAVCPRRSREAATAEAAEVGKGRMGAAVMHSKVCTLAAVLALLLLAERPAHAYIDPGSTSLFLQGLIGGIAALVVLTKSWWQRGLARLRGHKSGGTDPE
jgi:hypothetical protein